MFYWEHFFYYFGQLYFSCTCVTLYKLHKPSDVWSSCLWNQDSDWAFVIESWWRLDDRMCLNSLNIVFGVVKCSHRTYGAILILLSWDLKKISVHLSSAPCKRHTERCPSSPSKPWHVFFPLPQVVFSFPCFT